MNSKVAEDFFNQFYSRHMILYVGRGEDLDEEGLRRIARYPWSAVITSREDEDFFTLFQSEDRRVFLQCAQDEAATRGRDKLKLNRRELHIIQLFRKTGTMFNRDGTKNRRAWHYAQQMLNRLPGLMAFVNPLTMVGVDSEQDWDLMEESLRWILIENAEVSSVSIWGISSAAQQAHADLLKELRDRDFAIHETSLTEMIRARDAEEEDFGENDEDFDVPDSGDDEYFQANRPVSVTRRELITFKNVGTLLTERTLNAVHPQGRIQVRKWFSTFLECSASMGPQWYGYHKSSTFYVKRSFEDALVQLVRRQLEGQGLDEKNEEKGRLIVLEGDPGSSKSITLGALACRIYNDHINPVIFISDEHFQGMGSDFDDLDAALQLLTDKAVKDTRILVIWDSSAYRAGVDRGRDLLKRLLRDRGRRVVLVCSSYDLKSAATADNHYFRFSPEDSKFKQCGEDEKDEAQVVRLPDRYVVRACRELGEQERKRFWKIAREYSGIPESTITKLRRSLETDMATEIFDYYYKLIALLRDALERGLRTERGKVYQYVKDELGRALENIREDVQKERTQNPMYQAFLEAGFDASKLAPEEPTEKREQLGDDMEARLNKLQTCIALFSRFKLEMPYTLAYTVLTRDVDQNNGTTQELFRIATREIPWLHYGENGEGDFTFRFRNALEAEIYLGQHGVDGDRQVNLLCELLRLYGEDYQASGFRDSRLTDSLLALLRLMGPNSGYTPFENRRSADYKSILKNMDRVIDEVRNLIAPEGYGVPDEFAGFVNIIITFTREYYGTIWEDKYPCADADKPWAVQAESSPGQYAPEGYTPRKYELRIQKLKDVIELADQSREDIEALLGTPGSNRAHLFSQLRVLDVESTYCDGRLEKMLEEYRNCCEAHGEAPNEALTGGRLDYKVIRKRLLKDIERDLTNGYTYNALFTAFERMYEREKEKRKGKEISEEILQYLGEIMVVAERCQTMGDAIRNRGAKGRDEINKHVAIITNYGSDIDITMDDIDSYRRGMWTREINSFFKFYDRMLEDERATAIIFVCQKELLGVLRSDKPLDDDQKKRCQRVLEFMEENYNRPCVEMNDDAQAMRIRLTWIKHTGRVLSHRSECQCTKLNTEQWKEFHKLCEQYSRVAREESRQPILILLYALSTVQKDSGNEQSYRDAQDILNALEEEDFYLERRMFVPFMLCGEKGDPLQYHGIVKELKGRSGKMDVTGISRPVRFHCDNLDMRPEVLEPKQSGQVALSGLELGIGYTGFSVYTAEGRKKREVRS